VVEPLVDGGRRWRFGSRPSFTLVVAFIALMASVGGNAAAAIVISSNSQVAAHTIAGANAPAGDHQNLIASSVGTTDIHNGAITATKLAPADRPHMLNVLSFGVANKSSTIVIDELTIKIQCSGTANAVSVVPTFRSSVAADDNWSYIEDIDGVLSTVASGAAMTANEDETPLGTPSSTSGHYVRREGQLIYSNSSRVITVTFHILVKEDLNHLCEVTGTAIPASLK
jgi:hypothetical protein